MTAPTVSAARLDELANALGLNADHEASSEVGEPCYSAEELRRVQRLLSVNREVIIDALRELSSARQEIERLKPYERAINNHLCKYDAADWLGCSFDHTSVMPCDICESDKPHEHRVIVTQAADLAATRQALEDIKAELEKQDDGVAYCQRFSAKDEYYFDAGKQWMIRHLKQLVSWPSPSGRTR